MSHDARHAEHGIFPSPRYSGERARVRGLFAKDLCRHRGFTLIEIVAVVSIIIVLLAILLPALAHARKKAIVAKEQQAIESFKVGLEAYHEAWNDYPQVIDPSQSQIKMDATGLNQEHIEDGAKALYTALCLKLQIRPGSTAYGPFIDKANFGVDTTNHWLTDPYGLPYIYIPATAPLAMLASASNPKGNHFVDFVNLNAIPPNTPPMYNCAAVPKIPNTATRYIAQGDMQKILGDTNADGILNNGEQASCTDAFLLWAAGLDQKFGLATTGPNIGKTDDVTNFVIPQNLQAQ